MKFPFLITLTFALCHLSFSESPKKIEITEVSLTDKVIYGQLYYRVFRDEKNVYLQLVNACGDNVFARKSDLNISSIAIISGPEDAASYLSGGGSLKIVLKGSEEYVLLAFDSHKDGSICGWQITNCGSLPLPDANEDSIIQLSARIKVFFGGLGEFQTVLIKHSGRISEIEKVSNKSMEEQPIQPPRD